MADLDHAAVKADLVSDEGIRLFVYDDATGQPLKPGMVLKGHPTIGFGRALDVRGLSAAESDALLEDDIAAFDAALTRALPWYPDLDLVRRRVLVEMAFNLGVGDSTKGLLSFRQMLAAIEAGDWIRAKANMVASKWFVQVGRRGARLANLMLTGCTDGATS